MIEAAHLSFFLFVRKVNLFGLEERLSKYVYIHLCITYLSISQRVMRLVILDWFANESC